MPIGLSFVLLDLPSHKLLFPPITAGCVSASTAKLASSLQGRCSADLKTFELAIIGLAGNDSCSLLSIDFNRAGPQARRQQGCSISESMLSTIGWLLCRLHPLQALPSTICSAPSCRWPHQPPPISKLWQCRCQVPSPSQMTSTSCKIMATDIQPVSCFANLQGVAQRLTPS